MTPTQRDLYRALLAFPLDDGTPEEPFEARLARENDWDLAFARRVVVEYRRFLYLAVTCGHPVTPSDPVDQAWHLHLTCTVSYWERLCGEMLGRPLHHHPSRGGPAEAAKFRAQYDQTLGAYRDAFLAEPPSDIWPSGEGRSGADRRARRVDPARNWVVPKGSFLPVVWVAVVGTLYAVSRLFAGFFTLDGLPGGRATGYASDTSHTSSGGGGCGSGCGSGCGGGGCGGGGCGGGG